MWKRGKSIKTICYHVEKLENSKSAVDVLNINRFCHEISNDNSKTT